MKFEEKRFAIWGLSGFFAWVVFICEGFNQHASIIKAAGVALVWGIASVFAIASLIRYRNKR